MEKRLLSVALILAMVLTIILFARNKAEAYYGGYTAYEGLAMYGGSLFGDFSMYGGLSDGYSMYGSLSGSYGTYSGMYGLAVCIPTPFAAWTPEGTPGGKIIIPQIATIAWTPGDTPGGPIIIPDRLPSPPEPPENEIPKLPDQWPGVIDFGLPDFWPGSVDMWPGVIDIGWPGILPDGIDMWPGVIDVGLPDFWPGSIDILPEDYWRYWY